MQEVQTALRDANDQLLRESIRCANLEQKLLDKAPSAPWPKTDVENFIKDEVDDVVMNVFKGQAFENRLEETSEGIFKDVDMRSRNQGAAIEKRLQKNLMKGLESQEATMSEGFRLFRNEVDKLLKSGRGSSSGLKPSLRKDLVQKGTPLKPSLRKGLVFRVGAAAIDPGGDGDDDDDDGDEDPEDPENFYLEEEGEEEEELEEDAVVEPAAPAKTAKSKRKPGPGGMPPAGPGDSDGGGGGTPKRKPPPAAKQGRERDKVTLTGPIPVNQPEASRAWRNIVTSAIGAATGRPEQTTQWVNRAFALGLSEVELEQLKHIDKAFSAIEPRFLEALIVKCGSCSFVGAQLDEFLETQVRRRDETPAKELSLIHI